MHVVSCKKKKGRSFFLIDKFFLKPTVKKLAKNVMMLDPVQDVSNMVLLTHALILLEKSVRKVSNVAPTSVDKRLVSKMA